MSRSNPQENGLPNPATRWFEWNGEKGTVRYYDKEKQERIEVGSDFTFMLLDELASVRGWHDASDSGIYSNEVKDTRQDTLVVKSFKGGTIAEGLYASIKDRVNAAGGSFTTNCYIAFKDGDELRIGSIRFKGAALSAWMEFRKAHRADLFTKAIRIHGATEGKKGRITFYTPQMKVVDISETSHKVATALDMELQQFLSVYLKKNKRDQVEAAAHHVRDEDVAYADDEEREPPADYVPQHDVAITADDIPF